MLFSAQDLRSAQRKLYQISFAALPRVDAALSLVKQAFSNLLLTSGLRVCENSYLSLEASRAVWVKTVSTLQVTTGPSRRRTSRISANDVWVYWESSAGRDISRVKDLSPSGLFIETRARKREGDLMNLHFLVQEGQIRAEAVVKHADAGRGVGMKINSLPTQDAMHLHRLLIRLREFPRQQAP